VANGRETGESSVEQLARGSPVHVGDKPDAARIALATRVVKEALRVAHWADPLSDGKNEDSPAGASQLVGGGGRKERRLAATQRKDGDREVRCEERLDVHGRNRHRNQQG
jgi:hypothetical protein